MTRPVERRLELLPLVQRQTILMVDGSDLIRFVTKRQLALLGLSCDAVHDGDEALCLWRRDPLRYWLLLTDLDMPQKDGFDLARAIRGSCSAGARLPIVAYTGSAAAYEVQRHRRAGIDDCLAKPADVRRLRAVMRRWLPSSASA